MAALSKKIEVILSVAGEGGGYTILGEQHQSHWRFWRDANDGDAWMYDDDHDAETQLPSPMEAAPRPSVCYAETLDEALSQINSCWPRLHPIQVHPSFTQDIWNRVVRYCRDHNESRASLELPKWSEFCNGHESASIKE